MSGNNGRRPETRHVKKFMDGRVTPQEMHRSHVFHGRPCWCGQPAVIGIKVLVEIMELTKRQPEVVAQIIASNPDGPFVPTVATKYGKMVRVSDMTFCEMCRKEAERAAAKGPSWALVEIDRGPKETVMASVPGNLQRKALS